MKLEYLIGINDSHSISVKMRRENFKLFRSLISSFYKRVKILDLGGTQEYWEMMEYTDPNLIQVTIINLDNIKVTLPNFSFIRIDILDLDIDKFDYDIIFSHSLIEHVDHEKFAKLIRSFKKPYFIQTPNKNFPIEPHFLIPLFQYFPLWLKYWCIRNFRKELESEVESINLLDRKEIERLFPDSFIYEGKLLGLTQSFIVTKRKNR